MNKAESTYRIYELITTQGIITLKDIRLVNEELFKYQDNKGNFKDYAEAKKWLNGLSILMGDYLIKEVFVKA